LNIFGRHNSALSYHILKNNVAKFAEVDVVQELGLALVEVEHLDIAEDLQASLALLALS
jgi:hypothetical protein